MAEKEYEWRLDEVAASELLWCAAYMDRIRAPQEVVPDFPENEEDGDTDAGDRETSSTEKTAPAAPLPEPEEPYQPIYAGQQPDPPACSDSESEQQDAPPEKRASPIRVPIPFPLPQPSEISKALLPFARRVPGLRATEIDIDETVERTAEANGLPIPVFQRPLQRWFDVCLLIDHSPSMEFWGDLGEGVATLFRWQGIFRDVRVWQFDTSVERRPRLSSGGDAMERDIESLIAPGQHRLFIVVTDTLGKAWRTGTAFDALAVLGAKHPVAIAHIFPKYLWPRTALDRAIDRPLVSSAPGCANARLVVAARLRTKAPLHCFPIFNLSEQHFLTWAKHVAEAGGTSIQGVLLPQQSVAEPESSSNQSASSPVAAHDPSPEALVNAFLSDATPEAAQLASILAAVPLIPAVMRLAQEQFMPDTRHWHLAEVFFSGLVQRSSLSPSNTGVANRWYEYREGVRDVLLQRSPVHTTTEVWREIGNFIEQNLDSLRDALGLVPNSSGSVENAQLAREHYFAEVKGAVLKTWGGEFAHKGQALINNAQAYKRGGNEAVESSESERVFPIPDLEDFEFIEAKLSDAPESAFPPPLQVKEFTIIDLQLASDTEPPEGLERFDFTVATLARDRRQWIVQRRQQSAYRFIEEIAYTVNVDIAIGIPGLLNPEEKVLLEMVSIPGGTFLMGSPENEPEGNAERESPQHEVTVPPFFMGRYPVTQAQWRVVANTLPRVERDLKSDPSRFEGDARPVERVSWYDAVEFCDRLSAHTGRQYRLPTEAEWEYACRAGTTTPFHFGDMITTEVANYGGFTYAGGPQGKRRGETTPVDHFGIANAFGLSDMHGNVYEWCQDDWHENYKGAPTDGSAWITGGDDKYKIIRGGSWYAYPRFCRSAYRFRLIPDYVNDNNLGFRVVCSAPKALQ